jgi:RHS repeat-associated protein
MVVYDGGTAGTAGPYTMNYTGGNRVAETTYTYDDQPFATSPTTAPGHDDTNYGFSNTVRGNLTTINKWISTTNTWAQTVNTYDILGNLRTSKDPKGNTTSYDYTDNWDGETGACVPTSTSYAFLTKVTNPLSQSSTLWHYCTGETHTATDPNNQTTTYLFDAVKRVTEADLQDTGKITFGYHSDTHPLQVSRTVLIDTGINETETAHFDDLGRTIQTAVDTDPGGVDTVDIAYDKFGRKASVSNPHRSTTSTTDGTTFYDYDPLGRRCKTTLQHATSHTADCTSGAEVIKNTYGAACTTVTDPVGNVRKTCVDGLGRLVSAWEPNPTSNATFQYETDYQYNVLGNLICAVQKGGDTTSFTSCAASPATWRPRTFVYDSLARMTSATNPESGTISYTYDLNGNLSSKVAPKAGQTGTAQTTTNYSYDALNRLIQKGYVNPYGNVYFSYDGKTLTGCPTINPPTITGATNLIGRRTAMCAGPTASSWSYDPMGRPLVDARSNKGSVLKTFNIKNTYHLDGSLKTLTYPSGDIVTYAVDAAGNATQVSDSSNNYVGYSGSPATYDPTGALTGMINGHTSSVAGIVTSNAYNTRLQPILLSASLGSSPIFSLCYDFNLGISISTPPCSISASSAGNNGNVYRILNNVDSTRSTTFQYDTLNRITQGNTITTTGGNCWGETYNNIDAWGNLFNRAGVSGMTGCAYESLSTTASNNNRLNTLTYDAAGNVTNDGNGNTPTYDVENRIATVAGVTYTYDADGDRTQKSSGTMYWPGPDGVLAETDLSGTIKEEYIFFDGHRIARIDRPSGAVHYYFSNHLGSHSMVTSATGGCEQDIDYYPFGGVIKDHCPNVAQHYKFAGKERDTESGLDNFEARYDASNLGRFMTVDPLGIVKQKFFDPQQWNMYSYTRNNPLRFSDPTGMGTQDGTTLCTGSNTSSCDPDSTSVQRDKQQAPADQTSTQNQNQKETVIFSDNANPQVSQEKPGVTADRTVDYQAAKMDKDGNIDSHDIERNADLTLHEKLDPNSKTQNVIISDKPTTEKGVYKDYQEVPAGGSYRVLRDWKVDGNSARVLDVNTHKAYGYELTTFDANNKTPIKTEYTNVPPF